MQQAWLLECVHVPTAVVTACHLYITHSVTVACSGQCRCTLLPSCAVRLPQLSLSSNVGALACFFHSRQTAASSLSIILWHEPSEHHKACLHLQVSSPGALVAVFNLVLVFPCITAMRPVLLLPLSHHMPLSACLQAQFVHRIPS